VGAKSTVNSDSSSFIFQYTIEVEEVQLWAKRGELIGTNGYRVQINELTTIMYRL
jgi:hypothetical protein